VNVAKLGSKTDYLLSGKRDGGEVRDRGERQRDKKIEIQREIERERERQRNNRNPEQTAR